MDQEKIAADINVKLFMSLFEKFFKGTDQKIKSLGKWTREQEKKKDFFKIRFRKYVKEQRAHYSNIKIPWKSKPIPLKSTFVKANILEKLSEEMHLDPCKIEDEEQLMWGERSFGETRETITGIEMINQLQKFVILGKPGGGKTTFLKRCVLYALDNELEEHRIPIFISLKEFSDNIGTSQKERPGKILIDYITEQFDLARVENAFPFILYILEQGKALILLDGLDEVIEPQKDFVIREIQSLSRKYRNNQFIISCRIAAYNALFDGFTDVEMADFGEHEINQFILNWFQDESQIGNACWKELQNRQSVYELAKTPLLLTMLCIAYDEANHFPPSRNELYSEAIEVLLKTWDSKRRISRQEVYKDLSLRKKEALFSRIAAYAFENGSYFLKEKWLKKQIGEFIINLPQIKRDNLDVDSKAVLKSIIANHGILVPRADKLYSFSHLTFQEFFTAQYIVDNARKGSLTRLIENHFGEDRWLEVFLLVSEMLDEADDFVLMINNHVQQEASKVPFLFKIISKLHKNLPNQPKAMFKAMALSTFLDKAYLKVRNIELARIIDQARSQIREIASNLSENTDINFALSGTFESIELDEDVYTLNINQAELLGEYLKKVNWLLSCLHTESYIRKDSWGKILDSILTET